MVGQDELDAQAVNVRNRDEPQGRDEVIKLDVALEKLIKLRDTKQLINKLE